jgi:PEGA domain
MIEMKNHRKVRRSKLWNFLHVSLLILVGAGLLIAREGKKPLNEKDILGLLQNGVASSRIADLANQEGVKISLTLETERRLRAAGADDALIATLRKLTEPPRAAALTIDTNPGECDVYIDDEPMGTTSPEGRLRLSAVVPGKHQLRITHKGFRTSESEFDVGEGESKSIMASLNLATGTTATGDAEVAEPKQTAPGTGGGGQGQGGGTASAPSGYEKPNSNSGPNPPGPKVVASVVIKDFTFKVNACTRTGTDVTCALTITDGREDGQMELHSGSWWGTHSARMVDNLGAEYTAKSIQVGNKSSVGHGDSVTPSFSSGVPMRAQVVFEDVSTDATSVSLLEIPCSFQRGPEFKAQIRNIPLGK